MKKAALFLVAALALAGVAHSQSIGNIVGNIAGSITNGIIDYVVDGVDQRSFFGGGGRCANRSPPPPRDLRVTPTSPTSVRLQWRARDNSCVDFYEVTYNAEGRPMPRTLAPRQIKDYVTEITGLEPGTPYVFNVRAVNNKNGASSTAQIRATTPSPARCNGAPRPPMNVQTRSDSSSTLTVSWLSVANDPCVERYEVTYLMASQSVAPRSLAPLFVPLKQNSVTLTGLQADTRYNVVVAAVGTNGQRSTVTTTGTTRPACPPPRAPADLVTRQVGPRDVRASWSTPAPTVCIKQTQVAIVDNSSGNRGPTVALGPAETAYKFQGLQPGREYTISVRFSYPDGSTGPASSARIFIPNNSQGGTVIVGGR